MAQATKQRSKEYAIEEFLVRSEPYYRKVGDELELFTAAYNQHIPVLLKGPTGCRKTRFVEYMAWKLGRPMTVIKGDKGNKRSKKKEEEAELEDDGIRVPQRIYRSIRHLDIFAGDMPQPLKRPTPL